MNLITWAKKHYWDSLDSQKDLIVRHLCTFADEDTSTKESKSSGIAGYLASPLDIREQYKKESGTDINILALTGSLYYVNKMPYYVEWLEGKLVKACAVR
jgi:hypothetical protein